MIKINTLIVDDLLGPLKFLKRICSLVPTIQVVNTATNLTEALNALKNMRADKPEIILLDISLGDENGIAFIDTLKKNHFRGGVIFHSAYWDEYGGQAMLCAQKQDFFVSFVPKNPKPEVLGAMVDAYIKDRELSSIEIKDTEQLLRLYYNDIVFGMADRNNTYLYKTTHEKPILIPKNLKTVLESLAKANGVFYQTHKSYIVNINYIAFLDCLHDTCVLNKGLPAYYGQPKFSMDKIKKIPELMALIP